MNTTSFFSDMLQSIAERGRRFLSLGPARNGDVNPVGTMEALCDTLLSSRGEASGMALAKNILDRWQGFDQDKRRDFMLALLSRFGPDIERLERAIDAYRADPTPKALLEMSMAAEPRRQELIRRLNLAPNGIATLVRMRADLLELKAQNPDLEAVDTDFAHLFGSWFNRGFLVLRPISWSTPADILEKIIRYEAVHHIGGWDELRRRLAPEDRRCFAFFHPQLVDDPLIFVEVALTREMPPNIADLLKEDRAPIRATDATTAVFYSISNCQEGLRGISFGNFLIKQVVEDLRRDLPRLDTFVTLSPVPGFADWLSRERQAETSNALSAADRSRLAALDEPDWADQPEIAAAIQPSLTAAAAWYFLRARNRNGKTVDPVARFHLGNGARLERINFLGDRSERAMRQAHGLMVNYLYKLDDIETNHEAFATRGEVVAAPAIRRLIPADRSSRSLVPGPDVFPPGVRSVDAPGRKGDKEFTS
ncbi:malonyl-CoA decarboxylase (plasmid) [Sinorhizobium meliloti WSM1022]|uniref:MCD, Malonyl-CoA decarboxylase MCD n=1 Tax=Rhizobium meliloti TaxID=382 RepID=A0A6A7ZZL9_RHIML|nr:malonyl-CoA decarboxylase [Sinorhizobium meliloti]AGA10038.1 Malonyl-CoA decarboxylase (MCD) [Sinorhizobium meliloti GR4]MDE3831177.1 malonyl-CoA decarboxylase [Sinorhizobium meliloti]MDE4580050.1 malonyl-CoA decarboxylase [Sinorhizobium meliloti]MDW9390642.1 MCD, Malonyl-CoA decarboxylase MCD [Sinorhizobium meliloti]MDW9435305.1 MCD, Malonyl-CoA decarboxylase MCD [Sinorhizobium meliloti]